MENNELDKEKIEHALMLMGEKAVKQGIKVEVSIYGGCALTMSMNLRNSTKDVDAVFEKDKEKVKELAQKVGEELGMPNDWFNDAMKGYLSKEDNWNKIKFKNYPSDEHAGLTVMMPTPEYMLALKCIDIRISESKDVEDVKKLAKICGLKSANEAMEILESFYDGSLIKPKTIFALEEIFEKGLPTTVPEMDKGFKEKLEDFRRERNGNKKNDGTSVKLK